MPDKTKELQLLTRRLVAKDSAYSFSYFPTDKYSEEDFNFLNNLDSNVKIKFNKGILFDREVFYITTEPKEEKKVISNRYSCLTAPKVTKYARNGWCYLITDGEYQKIGVSASKVDKRLQSIQTGNPRRISIVAKYQVKTDMFYVEKQLHKLFATERVNGEWFSICITEEEFLRLCKEYD